MKLQTISIKNFRSIKNSGIVGEVFKIFALIGRNNAGKSSFLKSIQVLFGDTSIEDQDFHKGTNEPIEITGTINIRTIDNPEIIELKVICKKGEKPEYYLNGSLSTKTNYCKKSPTLLSINDIRNPSDSTSGGQKTTLLQKILKLQEVENQDDFATRYKLLSSQIEALKIEESKSVSARLTSKFIEIVNESDFEITVTPDVNIEKGITYTTGIKNKNIPNATPVDIMNSGTGMQSMFILSLLETYGELSIKDSDAIMIIEEPEVYLHPDFQRRMFAAIRRIAENNQVIFTTHSPIMIADIWLTESVRQVRLNDNGETVIENVKIENVISELGIRYEDVLNPRVVVFIEGIGDEKFYKKLGLTSSKLKLLPTDGFRAIHYYAFIKIISSENVRSNFVLLCDSDGLESADRRGELIGQIAKQFINPPPDLVEDMEDKIFVLERYAIESYFINEATLKKAFPDIEIESINKFIAEYEAGYSKEHTRFKQNQIDANSFGQYMKPKRIFELASKPQAEVAYTNHWKDYPNFLSIRSLIIAACTDIEISGGSYFDHLLECTDVSSIDELTAVRDTILGLLD